MRGVILMTQDMRMRPVVMRLSTTMHNAASTRYEKRSAWLVQTSTRRSKMRLSAKQAAKYTAYTRRPILPFRSSWGDIFSLILGVLIVRALFLNTRAMVCEAREGVEERREAVGIRAARFTDEAHTRFVQRDEPPFGAACNRAGDVEPRGELGTTGDEKRLDGRHFSFNSIYQYTEHLDTRERDRFRRARDFRLKRKEVVLHIVQNHFHAALLHDEVFGATCLAPPDERVEFVEHSETFKNGARLGRPLPRPRIKKFRRTAVPFARK